MKRNDKLIALTGTVQIARNHELVFAYLSNYTNDKFWRKPVNGTVMSNETIGLNTIITESVFLSRRIPDYISTFTCTAFEPNRSVTCETSEDNKFRSKNIRMVEVINDTTTQVTYHFELDIDIVKFGLGFGLPTILIKAYTRLEMILYLSALKRILQATSATL